MHNKDKIEKENVTLVTVFLIVNLLQLKVVAHDCVTSSNTWKSTSLSHSEANMRGKSRL